MRHLCRHYYDVSCFILVAFTILGGVLLSSNLVSADDSYNADVSLTIPVACTMTGTVDTPHTATVEAGTYRADIGVTTLKSVCNDSNGFSIYAIGYSGLEYGNNKMLATVGGTLAPTYDITTGTATSGDTSNWAMKLNAVSGTYAPTLTNGFGSYRTVPNEYTKVATFLSSTDATVGSSIQSTYAVYVKSLQPAGTYDGKVKYTLVYPNNEVPLQPQISDSGKICYYPNTRTYDGTMGCQTISTSATTARLFASNFSRNGYGFAGWSDVYDYDTNSNAHFYGPNEDITFTAEQYTGSNPGLSLYAVWAKSAGNFQDSSKTTSVCDSLTAASASGTRTLASVSALTDTRDNQTYAIAKLADGNCWMIENLRLDNTAQLTTLNTNNPLNDGNVVTLKHNYSDAQTYNTLSATSSVAYDASTAPEGWCSSPYAECEDQSRLNTENTANRAIYTTNQNMTSTAVNLYSYGNYYNWYSATAGRGTYSVSTDNDSTAGDLCPINWRLPKGGNKSRIESNDDNDFWNLVVDALNGGIKPANYTSSTMPYYSGATEANSVNTLIRTFPNNFVNSGMVYNGSRLSLGSSGDYWSSTAYLTYDSYCLYFDNSYFYPGASGRNKYSGKSVRCLTSSR